MLRNNANGPSDCLVTEMPAVLTNGDSVRGNSLVRQALQRRVPCPGGVENSSPRVPQKSQTPSLKRAYGGFRAIALLSVFSKWYTTVLVDMLHDEKEPSEWKRLHVGAERGVNCEHMQALVTNIFQRHWEWQEDRRGDLQPGRFRYNTALMASLDVKAAFDVARSAVVSEHPHLDGCPRTPDSGLCWQRCKMFVGPRALRIARQNSCILRCIRKRGVEAPVLWGRIAKIGALESGGEVASQRLGITFWRAARQ